MQEQDTNFKERYEKKMKAAFESTEKSFAGFFIKNFRFAYMMILFIVIGGLFSLFTLPREAEPEVKIPYAVVTTVYPGASPTDIEELVTDKIEDKIKNLDDLKRYTSASSENVSSIFVEFEADADLKECFRKLREATDDAQPKLPNEAETPIVSEINFNDTPIVTYSLVGDYSDVELKKYADIIKEEFESIGSVSKVEIIGGLTREFQIIVDQTKLAHYNITLSQIANAISTSNLSLPAGNIEVDGFKYDVRVSGRFSDSTDLDDIVITTYDNTPIFLRDVALIKDTFKDKESESRIGFYEQVAKNTISIQIYKQTGGNILKIIDTANEKINEITSSEKIPSDLGIQKTNDNSVFIREDLTTLGSSGLQTMVIITLILLLILSLRGAIITALAVPLAFLMAFMFLKIQGMTLNSMVLFSLVLSLGLMVDNSIVIIEGINEYVTSYKKSVYEAALLSIWNFKWAIISGTMTTVAAFAPMLLVSGILGEYMSILPKTISVTLLSSLFVAIIVIPTLASRFIKIETGNESHRNKRRHKVINSWFGKLQTIYNEKMHSILPNKKKRRKVIAASWIALIIAIIIPISGLMKIEMFPQVDMDYFLINIELPIGSTLDVTRDVATRVEEIVQEVPELDNYVTNIGSGASLGMGDSAGSGTYLASITVNLINKDDRERTSYEIADSLRNQLELVQGADVKVEELEAGPPSGAPIEMRIYGENMEDITKVALKITDYLENDSEVINVKNTIENSTGEFTFEIDKQKANYYGLSIASISQALRNAIYGTTATEVNIDGDDVDVIIKYDKDKFNNANDLKDILIFNNKGENVALKQVADLSLEPSLLSISHRDGKKIISVSADITQDANLQKVLARFKDYKQTIELPKNTTMEIGGETEDIQKSFTELFQSMGLAVLLIALILVLQFNSFKQPFIIIFSVPLAFIGVIAGLNLMGMPFSFTAFIGIVSLAGIVVNDAIVLIDRINKNIENGMDFTESLIEGGIARMQPIFLTSITTIAGVLPLIFASEMWVGLSFSIVFGLIFSTVLTLVIIPMVYFELCYKDYLKAKEQTK